MKKFVVSVKKLTEESLMREACEMTFLGESHQSLLSIYKSEHSPARTQMFWITLKNIPLFVATHLIRHHVGSVPFQLTCRDDKQGGNPGLKDKVELIVNQLEILKSKISVGGSVGEAYDIIEQAITQCEWLKNNTDRQTPVNLGLCLNAQSLIDMSKLRLCNKAHRETVEVFKQIKSKVSEIDPALSKMMVAKCVYRNGLCGEPGCCGYNHSSAFKIDLDNYLQNFTNKQIGTHHAIK